MNNEMYRIIMRDQARRNRRGDSRMDNNMGNRMDSRMDNNMDNRMNGMMDNRGRGMDSHRMPPIYSNEFAMGGYMSDFGQLNKYSPRGFDHRGGNSGYGDSAYSGSDASQYGNNSMRNGQLDGHYYYPFEVAGRYSKEPYPMIPPMPQDYAGMSPYLTEQELEMWSQKLLQETDEKYKDTLKKEHILKEAEEKGIRFDKFTKEEFYVTVLMMYTDFCGTLGNANFDVYLKLAKDWLVDDDIAVKGSEKLAVYHDKIVKGM